MTTASGPSSCSTRARARAARAVAPASPPQNSGCRLGVPPTLSSLRGTPAGGEAETG